MVFMFVSIIIARFCLLIGRLFVKWFVLCYQTVVCPVCLSVTLMYCGTRFHLDQDETWHACRPRLWPHCVRWGPSSPSPKGPQPFPQFSAHICCGQMAGWIKMPLGVEVGLGPGDFVLDWEPTSRPQKGGAAPYFWPMSIAAKRLDGSRWHLAWRWASVQATLC